MYQASDGLLACSRCTFVRPRFAALVGQQRLCLTLLPIFDVLTGTTTTPDFLRAKTSHFKSINAQAEWVSIPHTPCLRSASEFSGGRSQSHSSTVIMTSVLVQPELRPTQIHREDSFIGRRDNFVTGYCYWMLLDYILRCFGLRRLEIMVMG